MIIFKVFLALSFLFSSADANTNSSEELGFLQGMTFLGHGYNAIYANPLVGSSSGGGAPEGLTRGQSVVAFTPSDRKVKWNGNDYVCPAGVDCDVYSTCSSNSESFSAHGAKSMQESLQKGGGVSVGGFFKAITGSFTGSRSYTSTVEDMEENWSQYFYTQATCAMYHLKLQDFSTEFSVTDAFKNGVASLHLETDETFYRVVQSFGTHYTSEVMIGGQFTKQDTFEQEHVEHMESEGTDMERMAKVSFAMAFSAGGSYSKTTQEQCKAVYDDKKYSSTELYVGGAAFPESHSVEEWYQGLVEDESVAPMGSGMEVLPLSELLTSHYFPDDANISAKKAKMEELLDRYCAYLGEKGLVCTERPEDKIPPADQIRTEDLDGGPVNGYAAEAVIGTNVYRFGGFYNGYLSTTAIYDALLGHWDENSVQALPEGIYGIGAVAVGTDIFLFGGYGEEEYSSSVVRKYDTTRDSYAEMEPMSKALNYVSAAAVTVGGGTKIFYFSMYGTYYGGYFSYDPATDKHSTIDADLSDGHCLAASSDGSELWGVFGTHLNTVDPSTGSKSTFSDDEFPSSINGFWNQCAMTTDGFFYFLTYDGIWYMDTNAGSDKKWFKTGSFYDYYYSAVMIQDTLLITSSGYTDAFPTTPSARLQQQLEMEHSEDK